MASIHEIANFLWTIADEVLRDDLHPEALSNQDTGDVRHYPY